MGIAKTQTFVNSGGEIMLASLCDAYMQCWKYLGSALHGMQTDYNKHCTLYFSLTSKWLHLDLKGHFVTFKYCSYVKIELL